MPMTKEQWAAVEKALSGRWGHSELKCDGYDVHLHLELIDKRRMGIVVYVNGSWKGAWLMHDSTADETRRFMCPVPRYLHSPKMRAELIEIYGGKRCPKAKLADINKRFTTFQPYWTNFTALRRHLVKNNQVVELVKVGV